MTATTVLNSPGATENIVALVMVVAAVGYLFRGRSNLKSDKPAAKISGLLMLAIVALIAFGLAWEISECAAGTHFGDPGDGSNPFDRFCPVDKANGPETGTP